MRMGILRELPFRACNICVTFLSAEYEICVRPKLAPTLANYAKEYPSLPITVKGCKIHN